MTKNNAYLLSFLLFSQASGAFADAVRSELETVYVNAIRESKDGQQLPISVSVVTETQMTLGGVNATRDLGSAITGLTVSEYGNSEPQYFIRGVGSTGASAGEDHSVIVLGDGVYLGRTSATALNFLDLERVEVLKGPQGTLFGRNAAGGVIQLVSNKPSSEKDLVASAGFGSDQLRKMSFALGGTLSSKLAKNPVTGRLSFAHEYQDGDVENRVTGSDGLRENKSTAVRLQFMQRYGSRASVRLVGEYAESEGIGSAPRKAFSPVSPVFAGGFIPVPQPSDNLNDVTLALDGRSNIENKGLSLHVNWDLGFAEFESISAYRNNDVFEIQDVSAVGLIVLGIDEETKQYSQEFLLRSPEQSELNWTAGMYLLREQIDRADLTDLSVISDLVNLNPTVVGLPIGAVIPALRADYVQDAENKSYALFGEAEYPLTDMISVLLGLRYTYDKKDLDVDALGFDALNFGLLAQGPYAASVSRDYEDLSGRASLMFKPVSALMTYLQYSEAYKAGGFDGTSSSIEGLEAGFEPEDVASFEWGLKSQWFDNQLRFNAALFYIEYENLQVFQVTNNGTTITSNAAEAEIKGMEFHLEAKVSEGAGTQLSCTFLDSEYTDFISDVDDNFDMRPDDLAGNTLTRSPDQDCRISLHWSPLFKGGRPLQMGLSYAYQDDIFITPQNRPLDTIDGYGIAHAYVNYNISKQFSLSIAVDNLTDKEYKLHTFDADPLVRNNIESSVYARGRTWSAMLRYDF